VEPVADQARSTQSGVDHALDDNALHTFEPAMLAVQGDEPRLILMAAWTSVASTFPSPVRSQLLVCPQTEAEEKSRPAVKQNGNALRISGLLPE
jgi:hypothetical protein